MIVSNFIDEVKNYLIDKYHCHSMVLYGSYANGTETSDSDIDLICFSDECEDENDEITYELYREALNIGSTFTKVEKLIKRVSNKE